jgi:P27 family predicted phage terminase small subunit
MGERPGPPPKPTALKLLHGETRPSVVNYNEPVPPDEEVVPPEGMSDEALKVWYSMSAGLIRAGVLHPWDNLAYAEFCEAAVTAREAQRWLDEEGEVIDTPITDRNGNISGHRSVVNPWWKVRREASTAIFAGAARFGLTPADRTRIQVEKPTKPKEQDNSDLMSG